MQQVVDNVIELDLIVITTQQCLSIIIRSNDTIPGTAPYLNISQVQLANEDKDFDTGEGDLIYNVRDLSLDGLILVWRTVLQQNRRHEENDTCSY